MNRYDYSQFADSTIFLSQDYTKMPAFLKPTFFRLADALINEGKMDSTIAALDRCYKWFPQYTIPYDRVDNYIAYTYLLTRKQEGIERGVKLYNAIIDQILLDNAYYGKFKGNKAAYVAGDLSQNINLLREINQRCNMMKPNLDEPLGKMLDPVIERTAPYMQ
jgi:tetratricopeptide (TPR) repeat protein